MDGSEEVAVFTFWSTNQQARFESGRELYAD